MYVNGLFAKGVPTYEIYGKRKSIIDVCLTNDATLICGFKVLPNILGVNPQTSHRVLKLQISCPSDMQIEDRVDATTKNSELKTVTNKNLQVYILFL